MEIYGNKNESFCVHVFKGLTCFLATAWEREFSFVIIGNKSNAFHHSCQSDT